MNPSRQRKDDQPNRLGISFSLRQIGSFENVERLTMLAEELGFDSVWIPEAWGRDAITVLAVLATRTTRIKLATGIVNVFSRTPAITAQTIASLDDLSNGRAILGLGVSGPRVIEQWHGLPFETPLERTREFVEVVREILKGEPVDYSGHIFRLRGFSLGFKPPRHDIPIFLAAIGPANIRLAGEVADGWLPIFASPDLLASGAGWLAEGAALSGRSGRDIQIASYVPALLGPGADDRLRAHIAYYVGAMGSYYYRLMVRSGWGAEADRIRSLWRLGSRREAAASVSQEMLEGLTLRGSVAGARERLLEFRSQGVTIPILAMPEGATFEAIRATLESLSTA